MIKEVHKCLEKDYQNRQREEELGRRLKEIQSHMGEWKEVMVLDTQPKRDKEVLRHWEEDLELSEYQEPKIIEGDKAMDVEARPQQIWEKIKDLDQKLLPSYHPAKKDLDPREKKRKALYRHLAQNGKRLKEEIKREKRQKLKQAKETISQCQRELKAGLYEAMKPLVQEAKATSFKRTPEMRQKIVEIEGEAILKNEKEIIKDYCEFMNRRDIDWIKGEFPEVAEMKEEPIKLLKLAWEKVSKDSGTKPKITPEEWREREINKIKIKAQDNIAAKLAALKTGMEEQLKILELKKEMEKIINQTADLTAEEKAEFLSRLQLDQQLQGEII